ncbi:MAG: OmpA family protein [Paracoccaceae bacterium]
MKSRMKSTTALLASLSLMVPAPLIAQESAPAMICADGSELPCAEGVAEVPAPAEAEEAAPAAEEPAAEEPAAEEPAAEEPAAEEPAAEEPAAEEPAAEEPAAEQPAAEEPAAEAPAAEESAAEQPAAEQPVAEEPAAAEPAAEEPTAEEPAAQEPAADQPAAEAPAATEPAAEESTAEEPAAEEPAAAELAPEAPAEAEAAAAEPAPDLPVQPDAASGEAPVAAAASAEIDDNPDAVAPGAEVTEEVVTDETARSSDEDFTTTVSGKKKKKPAAGADTDQGLSGAEKAVLLGLGAIAVGSILSNNRKVELNSGDRVVVERDDGTYQIIKDDNALLRRPGSTVRTQTFDDGSTRTVVLREDGSRIITVRDAEYRVLKRVWRGPDGTEYSLIDDTESFEPVVVSQLPPPAPDLGIDAGANEAALRAALEREARIGRTFSLAQIRDIEQVRALVPVIDLDTITFETGSAAINPDQARSLSHLGTLISDYVAENPREMFLIEGHTDAVGSAASNLALSDRRAESVALALTEYFDVPPENLVVQGYGEEFLKIPTESAERANRRASVRRITDLLRQAARN